MTFMTFTMIAALGQAPAAAPLTAAQQIAVAVQAAPEERRADATVMGYDESGKLVTLRQGKNDLICLADNPKSADFEVDCYQKDLEPFMARGRELAAQGVKGKERNETRWKEIEDGQAGDAQVAEHALHPRGQGLRPGDRHDCQGLSPLGRLHAVRDAGDHRAVDDADSGRAVADVSRQAERAHHDRPAGAGRKEIGNRE